MGFQDNGLQAIIATNCSLSSCSHGYREINTAAIQSSDGADLPSSLSPESLLAASMAHEIAQLRGRFSALEMQLRCSASTTTPAAQPKTSLHPAGSPERQLQVLERLLRQVTSARDELAAEKDELVAENDELEAENKELEARCEALEAEVDAGARRAEEQSTMLHRVQLEQVTNTSLSHMSLN